MKTYTRTFKVKMLDSSGEFFLNIEATSHEGARVIANLDWPDALFISVVEV